MNLFLQVCETEEFIQHSFIHQVRTEWLWCTWHCTKHWGPSREQDRPLETCLSRHQCLLPDSGRCGWEWPGVDLAPGKTRGVQIFPFNPSCSTQISTLWSMIWKLHLNMWTLLLYEDRKPCPSVTCLSAAPRSSLPQLTLTLTFCSRSTVFPMIGYFLGSRQAVCCQFGVSELYNVLSALQCTVNEVKTPHKTEEAS